MTVLGRLGRQFGGLKVRYKLMVLHNAFFLVLAVGVWFTLMPSLESWVDEAHGRELRQLRQMFSGIVAAEEIAPDLRAQLDARPNDVFPDPANPDVLYIKEDATGLYRRVDAPRDFYSSFILRSKTTVLVVLGVLYTAGVLVLELVLMRLYVYRPLRTLLAADEASQRGDTANELIHESHIQEDELGQLMTSRNATVHKLRQREQELERALHKLETAEHNLAEQDRLASLGLLSAGVAHELNTPLAVLHGSIEKLQETLPDEHSQERLARMMRVTKRLQKMSDSLVDFARVRKQESEPVQVHPLIEECWSLVAIDERARGVEFENQTAADAWVLGNTDRLVQLFVNLLRNAVHAIQSDGSIRVRSAAETANGCECCVIAVEDDGPGIPADVLPNIFEAFVTTRLDARGTGLGLTVADGIARQHSGSIQASNRPEGGASLEVRLPAATPASRPEERA